MNFKITFLVLTVVFITSSITAQDIFRANKLPYESPVPPVYEGISENYPPFIPNINKTPGHYSLTEWRALIDAAWGEGLPTADKLAIFDNYWNTIDAKFACFHNHNINWDSIKTLYRPEIQAGVSRGRFQAIMNYISLALKEAHTSARDNLITSTLTAPGVPILNIGGGFAGRFGAGLTPLPDSTLLVYDVIPNHPLGLQLGDIVLGYDRIPWKTLIFQMLSYQLPIRGYCGSSPGSYIHSLLVAAGKNWYLFDTIDIVKYGTGDTLHLSTAPLQYQEINELYTEQVDIPGIPKPDYLNGEEVTYGVYPGTNIGYIYSVACGTVTRAQMFNAVYNLLQLQPDGLIFDFRTNFGGNMGIGDSAFYLLFPNTISYIDYGTRTSARRHTQMTAANMSIYYNIKGTSPGFNKPIAILTGPGAVSAGDQIALRLRQHPNSRIFGKSTNGAFNGPQIINLHADWYSRYAYADFYELKNPGKYLTHEESLVDERVWLTRDKVAQGRDDVVEAALNWINLSNDPGVVLFNDDAENGFENWNTNQGWSVIAKYPHSPVNSFTDSPVGNYTNKADNSMTLKTGINVSSYNIMLLSFWHRYNTQSGKDFCRVEVSSNNGTTWQSVKTYSGDLNALTQEQIDISGYAGGSTALKVRFRMTSDLKTNADGWYVDDIKIVGKSLNNNITISGKNEAPVQFSLLQNYPNPFNPNTTIKFSIGKTGFVKMVVYDITGREVNTIVNENLEAGNHNVVFVGENLSSGVYFYKLETSDFVSVKKMIFVK